MDFENLLVTFVIAWLISCLFYIWRIVRIAKLSGASIFTANHKSNRSSSILIRKLWNKVLISTIIFIAAVLIAYFVRQFS